MPTIAKSLRLLYVLEAVERAGVASPLAVLSSVAARLNENAADENLKRAIYRDLKALADQGRLKARYLSSSGEELTVEQIASQKNSRIEYSLNDFGASTVSGIGLLESAGGTFLPPKRRMGWRITSFASVKLDHALTLIIPGARGSLLALQLPLDEAPAKVLFARNPEGRFDPFLVLDEAEEQLGLRASLCLLGDSTVSRHLFGQRLGHGILELGGNSRLRFTDLGSSTGTGYLDIAPSRILQFRDAQTSHETHPLDINPMNGALAFTRIENSARDLGPSGVLQLGSFRMMYFLPGAD